MQSLFHAKPKKNYFCRNNYSQNPQNNAKLHFDRMRLGNRLAAGKELVGDFPNPQKGFVGFDGFVTKNRQL